MQVCRLIFDEQQPSPPMRSLQERMTNPTPADLAVGERLNLLMRPEMERIINHLTQTLQHLAAKRPDLLTVTVKHDGPTRTIRAELLK